MEHRLCLNRFPPPAVSKTGPLDQQSSAEDGDL